MRFFRMIYHGACSLLVVIFFFAQSTTYAAQPALSGACLAQKIDQPNTTETIVATASCGEMTDDDGISGGFAGAEASFKRLQIDFRDKENGTALSFLCDAGELGQSAYFVFMDNGHGRYYYFNETDTKTMDSVLSVLEQMNMFVEAGGIPYAPKQINTPQHFERSAVVSGGIAVARTEKEIARSFFESDTYTTFVIKNGDIRLQIDLKKSGENKVTLLSITGTASRLMRAALPPMTASLEPYAYTALAAA